MGLALRTLAGLALAAALSLPGAARADVEHVVGEGHTVEAIAHRYRVTAKAIIEANRLKDPRRIRPGDVLRIPKTTGPKTTSRTATAATARSANATSSARGDARGPRAYAARARTPGVVHLRRAASSEAIHVRVRDEKGRVPKAALAAFAKALRSSSGAAHAIDARLVSLLGVVSNHFGSRPIELVSGYRPAARGRRGKESNHNRGKAVDFRVVGVPNEAVRDFCRTLKNVGCGYYPNSSFVHMDVRDASAFWIDYSRPGQPPRYSPPGSGGDPSDSRSAEIDFADPEAAPRPALGGGGGADSHGDEPDGD